jgi:hypothetical protein
MAKGFLKPKVSSSRLGERVKNRGQIVNVTPYVRFGGFTDASKVGSPKDMALERGGPTSRKGKPV